MATKVQAAASLDGAGAAIRMALSMTLRGTPRARIRRAPPPHHSPMGHAPQRLGFGDRLEGEGLVQGGFIVRARGVRARSAIAGSFMKMRRIERGPQPGSPGADIERASPGSGPSAAIAIAARELYLSPTLLLRPSPLVPPPPPFSAGDHVFLVDGSSFIFRAYFQSMNQDQKYNTRTVRRDADGGRAAVLYQAPAIRRDGAAGLKPTHLAIVLDKSEDRSARRSMRTTRATGRSRRTTSRSRCR